MSNHIHLIAIPHKVDGLPQALKQTHGRYASYWNATHQSNGHLWEALSYTELNPGRAGLVLGPELWPWSSAACHSGAKEQDEYLTPEPWRSHWTSTTWQDYLSARETEARLAVSRQRNEEFIQDLEKATQRRTALHKRGPREKIATDRRQRELTFDP